MKHKLRKLAKGQNCMVRIPGICNRNPETVVLAHLNGAGWSLKQPDLLGAWCCSDCHDAVDGRSKKYLEHGHDYWEVTIWFYEGVFRTQKQLIEMGEVKYEV
jgi:hypothetical protein